MNVVVLAGGRGTRMAPLTDDRPKALVEIGSRPLIWHVLKHFLGQGCRDAIIAAGPQPERLEEAFSQGPCAAEPWNARVVRTGYDTTTTGRLARVLPHIGDAADASNDDQRFFLTWTDCLADVDLKALVHAHERTGAVVTVTAVPRRERFGLLQLDGDYVRAFDEKPADGWIHGAFAVVEPSIRDYLSDEAESWESGPLQRLAETGKLGVYRHDGFWACADHPWEIEMLDARWRSGRAPWKTWPDPSIGALH